MDVEVTLDSSPSYSFTISASCDRGDRTTMEDRLCVHQGFTKHGMLDYILLGLFDGHAGVEAAQYAKEVLPIQVDRLLRRGWDEEKALRQAFHDTNELMLEEMEGTSWYPAGIRATSPHSLNPQERARIARDGGQVAMDSRGDPRVVFSWCKRHCWARQSRCSHRKRHFPCLNITRSLGDFWSFSSDTGRFAISCDPDIRSFSIADDNIFALCLHSDGVVLSPAHIVKTMSLTSSEEKDEI
ncbi:unnamed protein product [Nippostrongylus brasiliensis]|uniref:Protein phosphatase 1D (inferred by orthology to a human protein) n=1 Tax=Nippostrongylus brasiliensis TaxID=27835 RepID=A0A0N4YH32_NIPBR|nr:unnamed protein product [Nippostrongylus brasiliensis]